MKRITLEVDDETAKAWPGISPELQKQIAKTLGELIIQTDKKSRETDFESHSQDGRAKAEPNELSDEGLAKLLDEEG